MWNQSPPWLQCPPLPLKQEELDEPGVDDKYKNLFYVGELIGQDIMHYAGMDEHMGDDEDEWMYLLYVYNHWVLCLPVYMQMYFGKKLHHIFYSDHYVLIFTLLCTLREIIWICW